jgi:hypothetical protein
MHDEIPFGKIRVRYCIVAAGLVVLSGCSEIPRDVDVAPVEDPRDRGELAVEYEICFPEQRIQLKTVDVDASTYLQALSRAPVAPRNLTLKDKLPRISASNHMEVRYLGSALTSIDSPWYPIADRKRSKDGVVSAGSALGGRLRDVTVIQQPVYFASEERFNDITGVAVSPNTPNQKTVTYWFVPPVVSGVPASRFTAWQSPVSIETPDWRETHANWSPATWSGKSPGRGLPIAGDAKTLPKIRYRLITAYEFYSFDSSWNAVRFWLPGQIAKQYGIEVKSSDRTLVFPDFIRPHDEEIPACD